MADPKSTTFQVVTVPKLPLKDELLNDQWLALAWKYRTLRLESLQTNPEAFGSTYEIEFPRGIDQTIERSRNPRATQIVAVRNGTPQTTTSTSWSMTDENEIRDALLSVEWVGMIVLVAEEESEKSVHYVINAMYTSPSARRQGLGMALIKRAFEIADKTAMDAGKTAVVRIVVNQENVMARLLYEKAGFRIVGEETYTQLPRDVNGEMQREEKIAFRMLLEPSRNRVP